MIGLSGGNGPASPSPWKTVAGGDSIVRAIAKTGSASDGFLGEASGGSCGFSGQPWIGMVPFFTGVTVLHRAMGTLSLWIKRLGVVLGPMPNRPANDTAPQWSFTVWNMRHVVARWCGSNLKRGWGVKPVAQSCPATGVVTHGLRVFIDDEDEAVHFWMKWADLIA